MKTLNKKMNQVADKIGVTTLGKELERNGYLVAFDMYLRDIKIYHSAGLDQLLEEMLEQLKF
jgi:hypothetical protein